MTYSRVFYDAKVIHILNEIGFKIFQDAVLHMPAATLLSVRSDAMLVSYVRLKYNANYKEIR